MSRSNLHIQIWFRRFKGPALKFRGILFRRDYFLEFCQRKLLSSIIRAFSRLGVNYSLFIWNSIPIFFTNDFFFSLSGVFQCIQLQGGFSQCDFSSQISHFFHWNLNYFFSPHPNWFEFLTKIYYWIRTSLWSITKECFEISWRKIFWYCSNQMRK